MWGLHRFPRIISVQFIKYLFSLFIKLLSNLFGSSKVQLGNIEELAFVVIYEFWVCISNWSDLMAHFHFQTLLFFFWFNSTWHNVFCSRKFILNFFSPILLIFSILKIKANFHLVNCWITLQSNTFLYFLAHFALECTITSFSTFWEFYMSLLILILFLSLVLIIFWWF